MKRFKRCITFLLTVIILFSFVMTSNRYTAYADSNDRRNTLMDFTKGKSAADISTLNSLTYDDLRMIGLFLSNYYIPFNTGVGETYDNDSVKEQMSNALVDSCGFDSDLAECLVELIFDMSVSTRKPLSIANGTVDKVLTKPTSITKTSKELTLTTNEEVLKYTRDNCPDATLYTFWGCMTGGFDSSLDADGKYVEPTYADNPDINGDERFYMYWTDDTGIDHIVWEMDKGSSEKCDIQFTPCTASYLITMDNANYGEGNGGNSLFSVTEKIYESLNDEQKSCVEMWNADMFVDCFGNILCDVGTQLYVVVPACNNPYAWYLTTGGVSSAGNYMQLFNFFNIGEIKAGHITSLNEDFTEEDGFYTCFEDGKGDFEYYFYSGDKSLYNLYNFRVSRGSDAQSTDTTFCGTTAVRDKVNKNSVHTGFDIAQVAGNIGSGEEVRFTNFSSFRGSIAAASDIPHYDKISLQGLTGFDGAFSDMVMIDTYQTWKGSTQEDGTSLPRTSIFQKNKEGNGFSCIDTSIGMSFNTVDIDNSITKVSSSDKKWVVSTYLSYLFAYDNANGGTTGKVSYAFNKDGLPTADAGNVDFSGLKISNTAIQEEIQSLVYYFLHPTKGISLVTKWVKNKVSGIFVSWHEDMVGSSDGTSTTGSTRYLGFSGYVTLPSLSDIGWTAWLLDEYNNVIVYLIIIIFIILITYCIVGSMTFQRAIIGVLLFGIFAFLPPLAINASVNLINNVCDDIYGNKFTYWALIQHQTYLNDIQTANLEENKSDYLSVIFNKMEGIDSSDYASVKLKWMAPKKDNVLSNVMEEADKTSSSNTLSLMKNVMKQTISGESFSEYDDALYLYRDYADIYMYQSIAYRCEVNNIAPIIGYNPEYLQDSGARDMLYSSGKPMYSIYDKIGRADNETSLAFAQEAGFLVNTSTSMNSNKCFGFLLDSAVGASLLEQSGKLNTEMTINGNDLDATSFGIANEKYHLTIANIKSGKKPDGTVISPLDSSDQKDLGYFYYGLYTESPFYFFTWNIYDQANSADYNCSVTENSTKSLIDLYTINNQEYFYNYSKNSFDGYGEMRDFCNMRSFFYYVIPYLRSCNEIVLEWDKQYGLFTYEDVRLEYEEDGETVKIPNFSAKDSKGDLVYTDEYIYKWWHNYNVERLFNVYTPYVDTLYDCDYAKPETISIVGEKYQVLDPLDPTSYFEMDSSGTITSGRMMVFSRSEMEYYGLTMKDLTQVEQKIIKVQDTVYKDLLQLMDYYDFKDDVLVTSAGMLTTFAFNKEFSQTSPIGTSYTLYPQSYELKAFSYDAYLRLILAESTGEDLMDSSNSSVEDGARKSYYQRVVENSSITTGIGLIILDLLAVYAIPALKLFFLIAIFFMSVLMIVAAAIKLEMNIVKTSWDSLVSPLFKFIGVSLGLAWLVSLFMSNGNTAVTGRESLTISLGDPVMVILVMIVINGAALILYYRICKRCFMKLIEFVKAVGISIGGAVAGTVGKVIGMRIASQHTGYSAARGTPKARGMANQPRAVRVGGVPLFREGSFYDRTADIKRQKKINQYDTKASKGGAKMRYFSGSVKDNELGNAKMQEDVNKYDMKAQAGARKRHLNESVKAKEDKPKAD